MILHEHVWWIYDTNVSNATVMKFANDPSLIHDIEDIMSHIETLKEACSTLLIMPKQYSMGGQKRAIKKICNKKRLSNLECSVTVIPLKEVLKNFLELPKVFETK